MSTNLSVLTGVDPGPEFREMVDAVAALVSPRSARIAVLLDDLPRSSARLDLVRLAVMVALEQKAESLQLLSFTDRRRSRLGTEWLISRTHPAHEFTFSDGEEQPPERTVTLAETGDGHVAVDVNGTRVEVQVPTEEECLGMLESGVRGTKLRFPAFPSSAPLMVARGDGPDELILWRYGLPTAKFRLPGPILAATYVSDSHFESLITLIEVDRELLVHIEGVRDTDLRKLHIPIDFSVADETEHDLSPLYLDMDEPWRFGVYFRRAGTWWNLRSSPGHVYLEPSSSMVHQPESFPFHTKLDGGGHVLFGPGASYAAPRGHTWRVWSYRFEDVFIPVPPDEEVLGLMEIGDRPALLTRVGAVVRARTTDDVRTVVELAGPVVRHYGFPWIAVQRSPWQVEVLDIATGAVLHRVGTTSK